MIRYALILALVIALGDAYARMDVLIGERDASAAHFNDCYKMAKDPAIRRIFLGAK